MRVLSKAKILQGKNGLEGWLWYCIYGQRIQFDPDEFNAEEIIQTAKDAFDMTIEQIDEETLLVTGVEGGVRVEFQEGATGGQIFRHPSYGVAFFSRRSGDASNLFGSSIKHGSCVALTISKASLRRGTLHDEWYHEDSEIVEVEFSPNQFAELLTNMNYGGGIPCTIRRSGLHERERNGSFPDRRIRFQPPYDQSARAEAERTFKESCDRIASRAAENIKEAEKILAKKSIGKNDREKLLLILQNTAGSVRDSLPFAEEQFHRATAKTVTQAKADIDATLTGAVMRLGGEELAKKISKGALPEAAEHMISIEIDPEE